MGKRQARRRSYRGGMGAPATLLDGGAAAYPRMLAAIAQARHAIRLEVYAFADDDVGERFVAALSDAALRGVRVSVVLDGWGSGGGTAADRLRDAGCQVAIYNPLAAAVAGRLRRNHRKVLLVDEAVAFLGGINVGDAYGRAGEPGLPHWIDLAVEVRGAPAAWLAARLRGVRTAPPGGPVRIHLSGVGGGRKLRKRYLKAIGAARHRVRIAHAYFLPDRRLVRTITAAARRGVDVRLVLPGRSDVPLVRAATRRLYGKLLRAGVRIHECGDAILHAKAAAVDGRRLLVGSFNLDPFSLSNLETLVEIDDLALAREGEAWIDGLAARAPAIAAADLAAGPRVLRWVVDGLGLLVLRVVQRVARLLALRRPG